MSPIENTRRNILRISILATIILIASVVWVNYERNIRYGDKTLEFAHQPMPEVLKTIAETYQVAIDFQSVSLDGCIVSATFSNQTLAEVMEVLRLKYKLEMKRPAKRQFVIVGSKCQ